MGGGGSRQTYFLDEREEERRLEKQNTMMVGGVTHCWLGWLSWFGHCPKAGKVED